MNNKHKVILIGSISILVVVSLIVGAIILLQDNSSSKIVTVLEVLEPLEVGDSAEAARMVKENTVKIINKVDDSKTIFGTGFFDKSGYLITNSHVVDIKGDVLIEYFDGTRTSASIVSNDILSDLAILSVEDVKAKALSFKSTLDLEVTDELYAIGHQFNLDGEATVTKGIVSAKRSSSGIEFIQTDAAINSGSSGGPLINDIGELLGIITLANENASMSMAISSDTLSLFINKLESNKNVVYIESQRPTNALSVVLKEVNYSVDDIYNEQEYLVYVDEEKDSDLGNDNNQGATGNQQDSQNEVEPTPNVTEKPSTAENTPTPMPSETIKDKDFRIEVQPQDWLIYIDKGINPDFNTYFSYVGSDLTNCQLDTSRINLSVGGSYDIILKCNENSATAKVWVMLPIPPNAISIPTINVDSSRSNVTSFDQIKGVWYLPGYGDVCSSFEFQVDAYIWNMYTFDHFAGKPSYNQGGGSYYESFERLQQEFKFWVEGDFLVVTTYDNTSYTLTKIEGSGIDNENHIEYGCPYK